MSEQSTPAPISEQVEYRPVAGFVGYRVGDDGSVWSCKNGRWGLRDSWHRLRPRLGHGYPCVALSRGAAGVHSFRVHSLVMAVFVGPCPPGLEVCHEDGDRGNPRLTNLRYGTRKSNCADTDAHGRSLKGERHPFAKATDGIVRAIRADYRPGVFGYKRLAKRHNLHEQTVVAIVKGLTWKHVG